MQKDKYSHFEIPLDLAVEMIAEYYDKMSTSDAFVLSMHALLFFSPCYLIDVISFVLHPKMKMRYFTWYWPKDLYNGVQKSAEKIVSNLSVLSWYSITSYNVTASLKNVMRN